MKTLIEKEGILSILRSCGVPDTSGEITSSQLKLFRTAFVHSSCTGVVFHSSDGTPFSSKVSFDRLEYLGDSLLYFVVANYLYKRFPDENEDFLSVVRIKLIKGGTCVYLAKRIGLHPYILCETPMTSASDEQFQDSVIEDVFESFIGACILNFGVSFAEKVIINSIEEYVDFSELILVDDNPKGILASYLKRTHKTSYPRYFEVKSKNPEFEAVATIPRSEIVNFPADLQKKIKEDNVDNEFAFMVPCNCIVLGSGTGVNKKTAEQMSAREALFALDYPTNT